MNSDSKTTTIEVESPSGLRLNALADNALKLAATFWFLVAVIGQWIFAFYVTSFYGSSAVQGNLEKWNEVLPL